MGMMRKSAIPMEIEPIVRGVKWYLYDVDFTTADGRFSCYIYACSDEHAEYVLEELKATAKISGRIDSWTPL